MLKIFELILQYFDQAIRTPRTQRYMCDNVSTAVERQPRQSRPTPRAASGK